MPTPVETLLSETADFLQQRLDLDAGLAIDVRVLLEAGQAPYVLRELKGVGPTSCVLIRLDRPAKEA